MNYLEYLSNDLIENVLLEYLNIDDMDNILQFVDEYIHKVILLKTIKSIYETDDANKIYYLFVKYRDDIGYDKIIHIMVDFAIIVWQTRDAEEELSLKPNESISDNFMRRLNSPKIGDPVMTAINYIEQNNGLEESELFFRVLLLKFYPIAYKKINLVIHILGNNSPRYYLFASIMKLNLLIQQEESKIEDLMGFGDEEGSITLDEKYLPMLELYYDYINTGETTAHKITLYKNIPILIVFMYYFERQLRNPTKLNLKSIEHISERMYKELPLKIKDKTFISNILINSNKYKKLLHI